MWCFAEVITEEPDIDSNSCAWLEPQRFGTPTNQLFKTSRKGHFLLTPLSKCGLFKFLTTPECITSMFAFTGFLQAFEEI